MALQTKAIVVGAGPIGCYAAARLCQSKLISEVHVYEKQDKIDPLSSAGRNVNVTLCKRGIDALNLINLIPGSAALPAKQLTHFTIYTAQKKLRQPYYGDGLMSVKRNDLYQALHDKALSFGAKFHFGIQFDSVLSQKESHNETEVSAMFVDKDGGCSTEKCSLLIGSDGVHSAVRKNIFENVVTSTYKNGNSLKEVSESYPSSCVVQEHGLAYREITVPQEVMKQTGMLEMDTFHIWGDTGIIVLGLPSADETLTLGVYMDKNELRQTDTTQLIQRITGVFPDLTELLSHINVQQEPSHSPGNLYSVLSPYLGDDLVVLVGDAGHAMLPFLGQGLNSGLEDVCILMDCLKQQKEEGSSFIPRGVQDFSMSRVEDIYTIVHQSFNECEKLQSLCHESGVVGKTWESSSQQKSFFELISTTNIGYKEAFRKSDYAENKGIGAVVKKGETLALYQSVKTMMTITSPCDGIVSDIKTSESGQPVYTVKPHGDNQSTTVGQSARAAVDTSSQASIDQFDTATFMSCLKTKYIGQQFTYYDSTGSTMDDAKYAAHQGCPSGSAFMAETMTKGRGRQGKVWSAPPKGNIYITFVLHLPEQSSCVVQFAAALAVAKAIRSEGLDAKVKWPNDIWVRGHKVSGILVEAETSASVKSTSSDKQNDGGVPNKDSDQSDSTDRSKIAIFYLGIGINVNDDTRRSSGFRNMATSISSELFGEKVSRERIVANLCLELESALDKSMAAILKELDPLLLLTSSSEVKVTPKEEPEFTAFVQKIDDLGRLHIKRQDTEEVTTLSDLSTSVRPSPQRCIYVYDGDGSSKQSVHMLYQSLLAMCDLAKYGVKIISPEEIRQGSWVSTAALLAIGGGFDTGYLRALQAEGIQIIRDYVEGGGRYLGICAGAYLACCDIEFDKGGDLEVCGPRNLMFYPGEWKQSACLLTIGGGFATGFIRALTEEGIQEIQEYVNSGGRYLGIGAGAYFGASTVEFDKGGPQERCRSDNLLNFFKGKCVGPTFPGFVYNSEAGSQAAHMKWTSQASDAEPDTSWTAYVYYNGGGHFEQYGSADKNVEIISTLLNAPDENIHTAAVKCQVGKGTAVLSGVHFEYLVEDLDETNQHLKSIMPKLRDTVYARDRFYMSVIEILGL